MKYAMLKYIGCLLLLVACSTSPSTIELQTGDLLFQEAMGGKLSGAIDQVTQTRGQTHFSHVGLVEVEKDSVFVLHASPRGGTCRIALSLFLQPGNDSVTVVAYRLKLPWQKTIPHAIQRAKEMLGLPYNFSYILSDTAHYCSEFVYQAFADDSVFQMNPMTFKDPQTGIIPASWEEYYQKRGVAIPEGEPGCNPNGMAASDKLDCLGVIE